LVSLSLPWNDGRTGRFEDPPESPDVVDNIKGCPCCDRLDVIRQRDFTKLGNKMDSGGFDSVTWHELDIKVGEAVFLEPGAYTLRAPDGSIVKKEKIDPEEDEFPVGILYTFCLAYVRKVQHGLRETSHPLGLCGGAPLRHSDWLSQIDSNRHHHSAIEGKQQQTRPSSATRDPFQIFNSQITILNSSVYSSATVKCQLYTSKL
jgi:hypothetical protein